MRVLLLDPSGVDAVGLKRILEGGGHVVEMSDLDAAGRARALSREYPLLLVDWTTTRPFSAEVVGSLRSEGASTHVYVIALTGVITPANVAAIFRAGVDDMLRRPVLAEELLGRVAVAERTKPFLDARRTALAPDPVCASAWERASDMALEALATATGLPVARDEARPSRVATRAAFVRLAMVSSEREVRLAVDSDDESLETIAKKLGRGTAQAQLVELLHELVEKLGTSLQAAAMADGKETTAGLAASIPTEDVNAMFGRVESGLDRWFAFPDGAWLRVRAAARTRRNVVIPATKLREGMIVVRDVSTQDGALLLRKGTRITTIAVQRVAKFLPADCMLEVTDHAA